MPITRIAGFLRADDIGITPSLGIESSNLRNCIAEVNRLQLKGVLGSPTFDFKESNLDFLKEMPQLTQIWFWDARLTNVEGIYALKDLQFFHAFDRNQGIDFARFPSLKHVIWTYQPKDVNLDKVNSLQKLDVWHFNPKTKTFSECAIPSGIRRLEINWANPQTLDGLPTLTGLVELQIHYCRNLASLAGIERIAPNLKRLIVANCRKCKDISEVSQLRRLRHLFINEPGKKP